MITALLLVFCSIIENICMCAVNLIFAFIQFLFELLKAILLSLWGTRKPKAEIEEKEEESKLNITDVQGNYVIIELESNKIFGAYMDYMEAYQDLKQMRMNGCALRLMIKKIA